MLRFASVFSVLVLTGCAGKPDLIKPDEVDPIERKIIEAARAIQDKSNQLQSIEAARYYAVTGKKGEEEINLQFNPGLARYVSLATPWYGPLDKFLIQLSNMAGMNPPRFLNVKPSGDVIVAVGTEYRQIIEMLKDASAQSASKVAIVIKAKENLLEVKYLGM